MPGFLCGVALPPVEFVQFRLFSFWKVFDFPLLALTFLVVVLLLGPGRQIGPRRHRESVGQQIGHPQDEDDAGSQVGPGHAADDGKRGDDAVQATVDKVADVLGARSAVFLSVDRLGDPLRVVGGRRGFFIASGVRLAGVVQPFDKTHSIPPQVLRR